MDRRNLPLPALRSFEYAAKHLHFGHAGVELGVTQAAIGHQVRLLEDILQVKLFIRAHNRLSLTPAGRRLQRSVGESLDRLLEGVRSIDPDTLGGSLIVGATQTIMTSWAAEHICAFDQHHPAITIKMVEVESCQQDISHDIDIAICYGRPTIDERSLARLAGPFLYPVCSPALISNGPSSINPKEIANYTLIHDQQVSWGKWLTHHDVAATSVRSNIYFANTGQAIRAAILGGGVALSNTLETQSYIRNGDLVRLFDLPVEEEHGYYLLSPGRHAQTAKTQAFSEWIMRACAVDSV